MSEAWDRITAGSNPKRDRRFWTMRLGNTIGTAGAGSAGRSNNPDEVLKQELASALSGDEALALVMGALVRKIAALFNLVEAEIDTGSGLSAVGVDSLVAVELRNWLSSVVQAKVMVFEILQTATMREFAKLVAERSAWVI
ncbi:hypothetical protein F4801DRAFT_584158 [Xylaria longipes]|nr:hypothetical protein F4801DRAFT_584158 [Xylaria longipes]